MNDEIDKTKEHLNNLKAKAINVNDKLEKKLKDYREAQEEGWFPGIGYLSDIDEDFLTDLKKKGFEITSIFDGFQVWIKRIGTEDEYFAFGESIEEAIDSAIPYEKTE